MRYLKLAIIVLAYVRYDPFGVRRQLSEHRLAYILWRYLGRWFRACGKLRAAAKKHLREKTATGLKAVAASRLATVLTTRRSPAEWPVSFKGNKEKPAGVATGGPSHLRAQSSRARMSVSTGAVADSGGCSSALSALTRFRGS
ncbi:hypothetical protein V1289_001714 [Bradyrhizobium sp. AZCC 2289]